MYNRLDRKKNPPDIEYKYKGGMNDLFDNAIKEVYIINDNEYDTLAELFSDEETGLFIKEDLTYSEAKKLLLAIKSLL